eukprot:13413414-Heterocapsa_arctica.AAC.1
MQAWCAFKGWTLCLAVPIQGRRQLAVCARRVVMPPAISHTPGRDESPKLTSPHGTKAGSGTTTTVTC